MNTLKVKRPSALKLHPVKNDTKSKGWCGPTVVASITNRPISDVKAAIQAFRAARGRRPGPVMGTDKSDLNYALKMLAGYEMRGSGDWKGPDGKYPTLARWLAHRTTEQRKAAYILNVSFGKHSGMFASGNRGHWVAVKGNTFIDTYSEVPVRTGSAPHRRKRVTEVWLIAEGEMPKTGVPILQKPTLDEELENGFRRKAIAAKFDIDVQKTEPLT